MGHHAIVHIEIPAHDQASAAGFYRDLFGWQIQAAPDLDYTFFQAMWGAGGGFSTVDDEVVTPGRLLIYVATDDIEATLTEAERLGGRTLTPRSVIPNVGWYAIFLDPTGNRVGLFTPLQQPAA